MNRSIRRPVVATILSFMTFVTPLAPVAALGAASEGRRPRAAAKAEGEESAADARAEESGGYAPGVHMLLRAPGLSATMSDSFPDPDNDGIEPGGTINYEVTVSNNGTGPATGVQFADTVGANTALDTSSITMSPLARDDSYTTAPDTHLVIAAAPGVLANDSGVPAPAAVSIAGEATAKGGAVTLSANGSFTYTPPPDPTSFNGADTFTYTAANGNLPDGTATVTISFTPLAAADTATVAEDAAATTVNVLANDTDPDAGPKSIDQVTQPANGTVVITNSGADLTYEPADDYCNDPPGAAPDTFTYTLTPGGRTATVSVNVTCADDSPTAVNDPATVAEDSGATAIDVLANDTDPDGGAKAIESAGDPANGTVVLTGGAPGAHAGLTYQPDPDYCGDPPGAAPDTFDYTLAGGSVGTVTVTVTCSNDAPTDIALSNAAVGENMPAGTAVGNLSSTDPDAADTHAYTLVAGTGSDDNASFQIVGNQLQANAVFDFETRSSYTVRVRSTDSSGSANFEEAFAVAVVNNNDAPTDIALSNASVAENSAGGTLVGNLSSTDADAGATHTYTLVAGTGGDDNSAFKISGTQLQTDASFDFETKSSYTVRVRTTDTAGAFIEEAFAVAVTDVNEGPTLTPGGATPTFTEDGAAVAVDPGLTMTDVDSTDIQSATVRITVNYQNGQDVLSFVNTPNITGSFDAPTGTLTLAGADTLANYQAALRAVTYSNTSQNPDTTPRGVSFAAKDGGGADSNAAATNVTVVAVNDAPVLTAGGTLAYTENNAAAGIDGTVTVADVDDTNVESATAQITGSYVNGQDVLSFADTPQITGSFDPSTGTLTLTGSTTLAAYQAALRSVKYHNTSEDPSTSARTVTWQANDGGPVNAASALVTSAVGVTRVNDAPAAGTDAFNGANSALSNTTLAVSTSPAGIKVSVTGNLLTNDTDVDTPQANLTVTPVTKSTTGNAGLGTGTVTINSDGAFTYTPPPGFVGSDSFTYTVEDNDPESPADQTATGTVNVNVTGPVVWYVNNGLGAAGNGTSAAPFNSLAPLTTGGAADAVDGAGNIIFLFEGNSNSAGSEYGAIVLENSQALLGQPQGLTVTDSLARVHSLVAAGGSSPNLKAAAGNTITLADANTVAALDVTGSGSGAAASGIAGTNSTNTAAVAASVTVSGASGGSNTGAEFFLNGGSGTVTFAGTIDGGVSGRAVAIRNRTGGTVSFSGSVTDDNGTGEGVLLDNNDGATVTFGGGVNLSTGAGAALTATNGGTVVATQNNTSIVNTLATTTGTALTVTDTNIGAGGLTFRSVSAGTAASGPANGIVLSNTGPSGGLAVTGNSNGLCGGQVTVNAPAMPNAVAGPNTADCTGGTIRRAAGDGISLNGTAKVSLTRMYIHGNGGSGVGGSNVNGFVLASSLVEANGDSAATDDCGIDITNLSGSAAGGANPTAVTNSTVRNNFEFEVQITNNDASVVTDLRVSGSAVSANGSQPNHGNLFNFLSFGTGGMTLNLTNSAFTGNTDTAGGKIITATAVQCDHSGTGGTMTCNVSNSGFTDNNVGPQGSVAANGQVVIDFNGNNIQGSRAIGVNTFADANPPFTKTLSGRIRNNVIGSASAADSGSATGFPVRVQNEGRVNVTLVIDNNDIFESPNAGINLNHGISSANGTGTSALTVTNNSISNITNSRAVILNQNDIIGGGAHGTVCADVSGNSFSSIAGQAGDGSFMRLREGAQTGGTATFNVRQLAATAASNASEVDDANGFNDPARISVSGTPNFNAGACAQPPNAPAGFDESGADARIKAGVVETSRPVAGAETGDAAPAESAAAAHARVWSDISPGPRGGPTASRAAPHPDVSTPATDRSAAHFGAPHRSPSKGVRFERASYSRGGDGRAPRARAVKPAVATATAALGRARAAAACAPGATQVCVDIGDLPAGKSVKIRFRVAVANPFTGSPRQVSNQGSVSYDESGTQVMTDDPSEGGASDPTVTPVAVAPDVSVGDAAAPEAANVMTFAVRLSAPAGKAVTVNFETADGGANPAAAGADYTATTGALTFDPGETLQTISVPVAADPDAPASDETFLVNLTGATNANVTDAPADSQATGTITEANPAGAILISEIRTSGPGGAGDQFVEVYNNSDSPMTVQATDASAGWALAAANQGCAADPVVVGIIPNGEVIPARGHYLFVGSAYSLASSAALNLTLAADIAADANVALFSSSDLGSFSSATRLDAVGFFDGVTGLGGNCDLLREGTPLNAAQGSTSQYSFFRRLSSGRPQDTGRSVDDFQLVSTTPPVAVGFNSTPQLGAPGPQRSDSPVQRNDKIKPSLIDQLQSNQSPPNSVRRQCGQSPDQQPETCDPAFAAEGTFSIRRRWTNNTGANVTRLRFRIVNVTTGPTPAAGTADLRAITSGQVSEGLVTVEGTTLEGPAQALGGGLNSTLAVGTIDLSADPLVPGEAIVVQFLLGVQQGGAYAFFVNAEAGPPPTGLAAPAKMTSQPGKDGGKATTTGRGR